MTGEISFVLEDRIHDIDQMITTCDDSTNTHERKPPSNGRDS